MRLSRTLAQFLLLCEKQLHELHAQNEGDASVHGSANENLQVLTADNTSLRRWTVDQAPDRTTDIPGTPLRVLTARGGEVVAVTTQDGIPRITTLTPSLGRLHSTATVGAPVVTAPPVSTRVAHGASHTFNARVASASTATPAVQWYRDGTPVPGATSETLTLTDIKFADAGRYHAGFSLPGSPPVDASPEPRRASRRVARSSSGAASSW